MLEHKTFTFPLAVDGSGRIAGSGGDDAVRGKIIQVLFTAPGERVHQPEFGCGLFNMIFEPNNDILAAAMEFTIREALMRWLEDDIVIEAVKVNTMQESANVEIAYTKKIDLSKQAVRLQFK